MGQIAAFIIPTIDRKSADHVARGSMPRPEDSAINSSSKHNNIIIFNDRLLTKRMAFTKELENFWDLMIFPGVKLESDWG